MEGLACRLCRSTDRAITREHIPTKSTGNAGPHYVHALRFGAGKPEQVEAPDGVALSVLCDRCNSGLGSRLGTTFADFAKQVQSSGRFTSPGGSVFACAMDVYPGRILRQLLLNFLCIQPDAADPRWDSLRQYIRSRSGEFPQEAPSVGLYYNVSTTYRVVPVGVLGALGQGKEPWMGAEVAAPGLGVVFTVGDPDVANPVIARKLIDVSSWGSVAFDQRKRVVLDLPKYWVETPHPLAFGRPREVEKWQSKNMIAWLATRMDTDLADDVAALLWRPRRKAPG